MVQLAAILLVYGTALSVVLAALTNRTQMLPEARATAGAAVSITGNVGIATVAPLLVLLSHATSIGWAIACPGMLLLGPAVAFALARNRFVRAG